MAFMMHAPRSFAYVKGLKVLFSAWLGLYGICLLILIARPLTFFILSGLEMAPSYEVELCNALQTGAIWLLPTGFLALAVHVSQGHISGL